MKVHNTLFGLALGTALVFTFSLPASAQSISPAPRQQRIENRQEARQDRKETIQENKEARLEKRCDLVNGRIDTRITRYDQNYDEVEARISRVNQRMDELADKLESRGYEVTKLRADIQILEEMRQTRRSNYTSFIQSLKDSKEYDCGDSQGAFKSSLDESKKTLATYRAQVKENWDFVANTIKSDLKAIKAQNPTVPALSE